MQDEHTASDDETGVLRVSHQLKEYLHVEHNHQLVEFPVEILLLVELECLEVSYLTLASLLILPQSGHLQCLDYFLPRIHVEDLLLKLD